jgi:hypothetical protein
MNNQTHPIEFFLACLINLIEFTCYIINELAGFHEQATAPATEQPSFTVYVTPAHNTDHVSHPIVYTSPSPAPTINPLFTTLQSLTVKQLQAATGIKSSRYRKSDLIALAAAY